ncbi:Ank3 [Symbiodinium pilosum]|uniref:Ank3 protein n=1 Tax=Symbiodinium pilosum TaxID=2952 RepID=A0A812Y8K6_SYMPI|nr:Ank3 [Symbiodinium pilosum]
MEASLTSRPSRPPLAQSAPRTCATAIGWPRQLPSQLLLPACVTLAGCVVRARKPLKPVRQSRQTTTSIARAARAVSVVVENSARQELADCDAQWMEKLLQERAAEILFNGVERTEPAPEEGLIYLYFPSLDIGPYSSQVRMTCRINLDNPQRAEVQVLEINPGLKNKSTGSVEYQKDLDKLLEANAEIVLRWQDDPRSKGLRIVQQALQRFKYYLPIWFPVPDSVTEAVLRTFITGAIKAGQDEVFRALKKEAEAKQQA